MSERDRQVADLLETAAKLLALAASLRAESDPVEEDGLLTYADAGAILQVSPKTISRLVGRGELAGCRVTGRNRIRRSALRAYLDRQDRHEEVTPWPNARDLPAVRAVFDPPTERERPTTGRRKTAGLRK